MDDNQRLAELLFGPLAHDTGYYEELYATRQLAKGAQVMRIAPSPTGFIHLGNLYGAMADERIAHQSGGVFFLRIEDTDQKRKVDGAVEAVLTAFDYFGLSFDEGAEQNKGAYGPYYQSRRADIYHAYAKKLVSQGLAYPCFCSEEDLQEIRQQQTAAKQTTGYYGSWARCRDLTYQQVKEHIDRHDPYVIRMRSNGDVTKQHIFHDEIKGDITVTENDQDAVLLKTDGLPTYHFAHCIDDHLMHTTIVLRGEEWLGTLNIHLQLTAMLGFPPFKYAHTTVLMKMDGDIKRKLSKRKDPELALDYYRHLGYHPEAVKIYLLTLLNWNFEEWYLKNPAADIDTFKFTLEKMGQSGALFDLEKLNSISRTYLARFDLAAMKDYLQKYVREFEKESMDIYFSDSGYLDRILSLGMGLELKKRRKDFIYARQILDSISYYFDPVYKPAYEFKFDKELTRSIIQGFAQNYDYEDDNALWFSKVKQLTAALGLADEMSEYKAHPDKYRGSVSDVAETIRVAMTGRRNTPDLWSIMQIMGPDRIKARLQQVLAGLA